MFKSIMSENGRIVYLQFDGEVITAFDGDNLAAALLRAGKVQFCLLYTSPSPRDLSTSRMPSSA